VQESGDIRVIADEANNALVILATATEFRMIEATLKKLDIIPLQVLIEATILEVTLNDQLEYGVQWFFESGNFLTQFASTGLGPAGAGFTFLFDSNDKAAVLTALTQVTDTKVISSPQLMVLDNQSARLQVGDQVPFLSSATDTSITVGDGSNVGVAQFQQIDTGVVLNVSPRINAGGLVVLEITQEVSNVSGSGVGENPIIAQRQIESTIAVQSGQTVALGGLIQDDQNDTVIGVPILSEIPILGHLFKTTTDTTIRRELLVLITPRVVRNQVEARKVTKELRRRLKAIEPLEQRIKAPAGSSS
jgi:general secretion pathway protein D